MKLRLTLFLLAGFLCNLLLTGQEIPDVLKKRDEIYFTFLVKNRAEINELTKKISIHNVKGDTVWAFANTRQYLEFIKLGYEMTLLPSPGDGPGVVMSGNGQLSPHTVWNYYPTYSAYESLMAQFQTLFPSICNLDTITTLASGRRILVLKISDNVNTDETEPEFLYSSSIHGNETTGYILMMHLADYLLTNYGTNAEATDLVNNMEIFICPLANPDGTYFGGNSSVSGARRANINGVDLNRNYPDPQDGLHPDGNASQPETVAFMDFAGQHHFVAGANFHDGAEVVNYPWDTWATLHPDDAWFQLISREYVDTVHLHSPSTYMDGFVNGITNGYAWYEVNGGRQDYMNYFHHCREITIELSNTMLLPAAQLLTHWDYNWRSFIKLLQETRYGIQGIITDQVTGLPVPAKVFIVGHDNNNSEVYASANLGDYHRPVKGGTYTLEISAPCYQTQTISGVTVADHAILTLNIQMVPGTMAAVTTTAATAVTSTGAVSGGNVTCAGNTAVTVRGVCWSTSVNPVVTGNHTTNGSGPGTFTSQITGLAASTIYHVRAYATNGSGTYYGADVQFTTSCGSIASFPWNEGFENAGAIPACWTQEQVNASGLNWVFITGNGTGYPSIAHGGAYDACLKDLTTADNKTKLITPPMNLSGLPSPQLKFWHTQPYWSPDQDQLIVFYKTSAGGAWNQLVSYTTSITAWTQETIALPAASAEYYIAFEGNAKYGRGVCIDDVQVSSSCTTIYPVSVSVSASSNPVCAGAGVTFLATPQNGGTTPLYQWKVNDLNAGSGSTSFNYIPSNNDAVKCILTSNASCITGNPATSNTITMTVNPLLPVSVSIEASANPVALGTAVTFTATPVNGGVTSVYQWLVNNSNSGTNNESFTYTPANGDVVKCVLASNMACASGNPATSNAITMNVVEIPIVRNVNDIIVAGSQCFDALQTIFVAGNETSFTVQSGGSVTMIAGQNIVYYPGTMVLPGGYLYGFIAPAGPWCSSSADAILAGIKDADESNTGRLYRVYPNPTTGAFYLDLLTDDLREPWDVAIYGITGEKVLSDCIVNECSRRYSLSGMPEGIYLLRISSGNQSEVVRIIKTN